MPGEMMTIRQVARLLRVGDRVVRAWIRSGELAVINLGDPRRARHRVSDHDLQKFLATRRVEHKPASPAARKSATRARWF